MSLFQSHAAYKRVFKKELMKRDLHAKLTRDLIEMMPSAPKQSRAILSMKNEAAPTAADEKLAIADRTAALVDCKKRIVDLAAEKSRAEALALELANERALLTKEAAALRLTLAAVDADVHAASAAHDALTARCALIEKDIANAIATEYDPLVSLVNPLREKHSMPPISLLQDDIEMANSRKVGSLPFIKN
ncbi:hypothetical protein HDU82_004418 [Entophlyctis luteolus]|nr:hypothetical protein HDU82_004418 [Entophlyctis luteolus]